MDLIKIINCKIGKHDWVRVPVPDNKYEAWECAVCGQRKVYLNLEEKEIKE
jgi:hypothetical protein